MLLSFIKYFTDQTINELFEEFKLNKRIYEKQKDLVIALMIFHTEQ